MCGCVREAREEPTPGRSGAALRRLDGRRPCPPGPGGRGWTRSRQCPAVSPPPPPQPLGTTAPRRRPGRRAARTGNRQGRGAEGSGRRGGPGHRAHRRAGQPCEGRGGGEGKGGPWPHTFSRAGPHPPLPNGPQSARPSPHPPRAPPRRPYPAPHHVTRGARAPSGDRGCARARGRRRVRLCVPSASSRFCPRRHVGLPRRGGDRGLRVRRGDRDLQLPVPLRGPLPHHAGNGRRAGTRRRRGDGGNSVRPRSRLRRPRVSVGRAGGGSVTAFPGLLQEDLENGEDVATCPSCSLILRVIYDQVGGGEGAVGHGCGLLPPAPGRPSRVPVRHPLRRARWQLLKAPGERGIGSCGLVVLLLVTTAPASILVFLVSFCGRGWALKRAGLLSVGWNTDKAISLVLGSVYDSSGPVS